MYGLALLNSDYTGDCVTVRRASDNGTQNIGFDGQDLDIAALEAFCSGTDGFVTTWFDQSGNANNAVQTTASLQPKIFDSINGVILENGKPAIEFDGVDDTLQYDFTPDEVQPFTVFYIRRYRNTSSTYVGLAVDSASSTGYAEISNSSEFRSFYGAYLVDGASNTNQGIWYSLGNGANSEIGLDSAAVITGNAGANGLELLSIGSAAGAFSAPINAQSVIIYPDNQSSNRTGIETALNDYYSIY